MSMVIYSIQFKFWHAEYKMLLALNKFLKYVLVILYIK